MKRVSKLVWFLVLTVAGFLATPPAWGQATTSLRGTVTDSMGAAVPSSGTYTFESVLPGPYKLTVEAKGFRTYSQSELELLVDLPATLNVQLLAVLQPLHGNFSEPKDVEKQPDNSRAPNCPGWDSMSSMECSSSGPRGLNFRDGRNKENFCRRGCQIPLGDRRAGRRAVLPEGAEEARHAMAAFDSETSRAPHAASPQISQLHL